MSNKEREAEEDTAIVDHLQRLAEEWERFKMLVKDEFHGSYRFPSPDPRTYLCLRSAEVIERYVWLN